MIHILTLALKVLQLGKTDFIPIREDRRGSAPSPGRDRHRGIFADRLLGAILVW
jgi:hypothetical protein